MTSESFEKSRNSCNSTGETSKCPEMNHNDIRQPSETSQSLEFHLYGPVMFGNGQLYNQKTLEYLEIPGMSLE